MTSLLFDTLLSVNYVAEPPFRSRALKPLVSAQTYTSLFTYYGSGDKYNSPNCNNGGACGLKVNGFSTAVSQNLFGVGGGQGAGPACGTCWKLVLGSHSITVTVNNLCPAGADNPLCSQSSLTATNSEGAEVNFDLCSDSGASAAFFGDGLRSSGWHGYESQLLIGNQSEDS